LEILTLIFNLTDAILSIQKVFATALPADITNNHDNSVGASWNVATGYSMACAIEANQQS